MYFLFLVCFIKGKLIIEDTSHKFMAECIFMGVLHNLPPPQEIK